MFSAILKDRQKCQEELKAEATSTRLIAEKAVENLTAKTVKELNDDIAKAYLNQHKLDTETRKLQTNVTKLTKQAQQWMMVCDKLNSAVKDIGDISTWTNTIEKDIKFITDAIEESYRPGVSED